MEVKHQVFVSSTYRDLIEERKAVIHALLELDCIPAGMELFPAADEDAWTLIKNVIDDCDYYVLILAGKYGSLSPDGAGYTEMEFDYAVSVNKPIIAFLHDNPETLPASSTEKTEVLQKKLNSFRDKAKGKHCKFWLNSEDLGGKVSRSLIQLRKRHPSPGWVPGRYAATDSTLRELEELRARVVQLELEAAVKTSEPPADASELAQGSDEVYLPAMLPAATKGKTRLKTLSCTWDTLFSYIGPSMINECTDEEMFKKVELAFYHKLTSKEVDSLPTGSLIIPFVLEDKIRVQFQALGLIAPGLKRRAVSDINRYWRLTPYGEKYLMKVKAERRDQV